MKTKTILISIFFVLSISSCSTTEPPPPPDGDNPVITLVLDDVSCTEAWIKLTTTNLQLPTTLTIKQNDIAKDTINLSSADTLLYTNSLLPNTNYRYQVSSIQYQVLSNEVNITTMDTTSHNFTFETFTFGGGAGSCTLYDVAIISENYIIAVGTIFLTDSIGQPDPQPYGIAIWDGQSWELKKLFYNTNIPVTPRGIFVVSPTEIYLASGSIFKWDGSSSTVQLVYSRLNLPDPNATIEKLWGSSGSSIYGVGNAGSIVFYNGIRWTRIESGTETRINDVWGLMNNNGKNIIYCPVSSFFVEGEKKILKIEDGFVYSVSWSRDVRLYSAWAESENILYVCGEGVYVNKFGIWDEIDLYTVGTNSVRGNNINDIFVVGDYGAIFHFNGENWKMISGPNNKGYSKVVTKDNTVVTCGNYQGQGLIEIGKRD